MFGNSADLSVREVTLNSGHEIKALIITMEGMVDKEGLAQSAINPLMAYNFKRQTSAEVFDTVLYSVLASSDVTAFDGIDKLISFITSGFTVIAIDGAQRLIAIGAQGFAFRGVSEPESEVVQRGAREGFTEPLRVNMSLIRRRIKDPNLVFEQVTVGEKSKTQLMLCYLKSAASPKLLNKLRMRLNSCDYAVSLRRAE